MILSYSSIIACSISLTLLTCILYLFLKVNAFISKAGIFTVYLLSLLIIIRACLPFDFYYIHLTHTYLSEKVIPFMQKAGNTSVVSTATYTVSLADIIFFVWFSVASVIFFKRLLGYLLSRKKLRDIPFVLSQNIRSILSEAKKEILPNSRKKIKVLKLNNIHSPASFGIMHPMIILPDIEYTDQELYFVFIHELLHIKNHDFIAKLISDFVLSLHWWNIIVFRYLPRLLHQIQELLVDQLVLVHFPQKQDKICYLNCIVKTIKHPLAQQGKSFPSNTLCDFSSEKSLLQRFYFMSNTENIRCKSALFTIVFCILFIFSFTFVFEAYNKPAYSESGQPFFYLNEENSYYIQRGDSYDLYLDGSYVYTTDTILSEFKDLPVYLEKE